MKLRNLTCKCQICISIGKIKRNGYLRKTWSMKEIKSRIDLLWVSNDFKFKENKKWRI